MQGKLLLPLAALITVLAGCETNEPVESTGSDTTIAEPRQLSAFELESRADREQGTTRNATLLEAADQRAASGEWDALVATLQRLESQALSAEQDIHARILRARAYQQSAQTEAAISTLAVAPLDTLPNTRLIEFYRLRGQLYEAHNQPIAAAEQHIRLDSLLFDQIERLNNQTAILMNLSAVPSAELQQLAEQRSGVTLGWIDLLRSLRVYPANHTLTPLDLAVWRSRYTQHPADLQAMQAALPGLAAAYQPVERLALLIPETGPLQTLGRAVREGFLAAHYTVPVGQRPDIRIIDSAANEDIVGTYQQLVSANVSRVVGPISKNKIASLASLIDRPVPILAMNTLQNDPSAYQQLYQFGLLPEHDAVNLAERVVVDGVGQVALLVPKDARGDRIANAFLERLNELGGQVVAVGEYDSQSFNNGAIVRDMLGIDESPEAVLDRTTVVDGKTTVADPVPDENIQAVVIAAHPQQARLLRPLLKFYYGAHLPVYATSNIYTGTADPLQDKDLNGVIFGDMPWVLHSEHFGELSRSNVERQFPITRSNLRRLFALGADAYRLATDERQLDQIQRSSGLTGWLSVDELNRVQRELAWATFRKGVVQAEQLPNNPEPLGNETTIAPAIR